MPRRKEVTIWVWPDAPLSKKLFLYWKAKQLPISVLGKRLTIIPIKGAEARAGYEPVPEGFGLEALRVGRKEDANSYVTSAKYAIETFEDMFPQTHDYSNLVGRDFRHWGRIRDVLRTMNEIFELANFAAGIDMHNLLGWERLEPEEQSPAACSDALHELRELLEKLEERLVTILTLPGNISIAGGEIPCVADFSFVTAVSYLEHLYEFDLLRGRELLKEYYRKYQESEWWISAEERARIRSGDYTSLFVADK